MNSQRREIHSGGIQKSKGSPLSSVGTPPLRNLLSTLEACMTAVFLSGGYIVYHYCLHHWLMVIHSCATSSLRGWRVGMRMKTCQPLVMPFFLETSHSTGDHQPSVISLANKRHPWDCKELKSCMPGDRWETNKLFLVNRQYHTFPQPQQLCSSSLGR